VAQVAIAHGLDPFNGEVWGIKYEKNGEWVWAGVMVGVKGLRKAARRQGNFWTEFKRIAPDTYGVAQNAVVYECWLRDTDKVQKYGATVHALVESHIPYKEAIEMLGPAPVSVGVGIATPDEKSKMGLHARARKRAEADAIKQAYDVQFGGALLENGSVIEGQVQVLGYDDDHGNGQDNGRISAVVHEALPEPEPEVVAETSQVTDALAEQMEIVAMQVDMLSRLTPDDIYDAVVAAGLSHNSFAAKKALDLCSTGYTTPEIAIAWMRNYRGWRDVGLATQSAAEKANQGLVPV
jgi:hypothetical protein